MPHYDYRCAACGHEFELFQSMTAPVQRKCPACGKLRLERLIGTGAGVIFKGGGFYETDYRSESYRKAAEAESKGATEASGTAKEGGASSEKGAGETSAKPAAESTSNAKSESKSSSPKEPGRKAAGGKDASKSGSSKKDAPRSSKAPRRSDDRG